MDVRRGEAEGIGYMMDEGGANILQSHTPLHVRLDR
jgi:hypothetical protein